MKNELIDFADKVEELYSKISKDNAVPDVDVQKINRVLFEYFSFNNPRSVSEITRNVNRVYSTQSSTSFCFVYAKGKSVQVFFDYRRNCTMQIPNKFFDKILKYTKEEK